MKYQELIKTKISFKKISPDELYDIIESQNEEYLKYWNDEVTIYVENHRIEGKRICFEEDLHVNARLTFKDCFFVSEGLVFINGIVCKNYVTFENCYFTNGIYINDGIFTKELAFKPIHTTDITIRGGRFGKISLSGYDLKEVRLSGGRFESFNFSEYVADDNIGALIIQNKQGGLGDISISDKYFDRISISGTNADKVYNFNNIKCDHFLINNFTNTGSLNIFGVEPKNPFNEKIYFQITHSNLNKAQFYRAMFSMYKELVIIDSYISSCLFIACSWRNNIRGMDRIASYSLEKSLHNNRKVDKEEKYKMLEGYRQLKTSMNTHHDKIQEAKFYAMEMTIHSKLLRWSRPWQDSFWDKLILGWSRIFSGYGQSFFRPLFFLLVGHLIFINLAILLGGFEPLHISTANPTANGFKIAFEKYFIFINPFRKIETSLTGYLILLDLIMRIWSSYMIYNIIRASRRFIN